MRGHMKMFQITCLSGFIRFLSQITTSICQRASSNFCGYILPTRSDLIVTERIEHLTVESNLCEQVHWGDHDPFKYTINVNWVGILDHFFLKLRDGCQSRRSSTTPVLRIPAPPSVCVPAVRGMLAVWI